MEVKLHGDFGFLCVYGEGRQTYEWCRILLVTREGTAHSADLGDSSNELENKSRKLWEVVLSATEIV